MAKIYRQLHHSADVQKALSQVAVCRRYFICDKKLAELGWVEEVLLLHPSQHSGDFAHPKAFALSIANEGLLYLNVDYS